MALHQMRSQQSSTEDQEDERQHRHLRFCFFWISMSVGIVWILIVVITGLVAFLVTLNPLYLPIFTVIAPAILWMRWAVSRVIPLDEKTFELEKIRLQAKVRRPHKYT